MMPKYHTLSQLQTHLQQQSTSVVDTVEYYLQQIEATRELNIYVQVFADEARQQATALDQKYKADPNSVGRLFGAIISIKDVLCYANHTVTAASKILEGFQSIYTATCIQRLLDEDAIIIGVTNCDQFAMGSTNENSVYGPTRNAVDPNRVPGGSSGGAAVAVQADTCLIAIGTSTGGSVRQPAALCGVIGMKPTYGRISRYGLLAYGSSFDQAGVMSNSIEDAALTIEIMAGADEFDSTASQRSVPPLEDIVNRRAVASATRKKIAVFDTVMAGEGLDEATKDTLHRTIAQLKAAGHSVEGVNFEYLDYIVPAYYVLTTAEASSNLSRYDGIRFGYRSREASNLQETYRRSRTEGFSEEVKRRIMLGTFVLSAGYYDAYYTKAQKVRRLIADKTREILQTYDFILLPVSPTVAWNIGQLHDDPVQMYLADIFTVQANMVGIPAIALPLGTSDAGLPVGLQLMGNKFEEAELLSFSKEVLELEKAGQ